MRKNANLLITWSTPYPGVAQVVLKSRFIWKLKLDHTSISHNRYGYKSWNSANRAARKVAKELGITIRK